MGILHGELLFMRAEFGFPSTARMHMWTHHHVRALLCWPIKKVVGILSAGSVGAAFSEVDRYHGTGKNTTQVEVMN